MVLSIKIIKVDIKKYIHNHNSNIKIYFFMWFINYKRWNMQKNKTKHYKNKKIYNIIK